MWSVVVPLPISLCRTLCSNVPLKWDADINQEQHLLWVFSNKLIHISGNLVQTMARAVGIDFRYPSMVRTSSGLFNYTQKGHTISMDLQYL